MATVKDIVSLMEEIAPEKLSGMYCEKYGLSDSGGLVLGDADRQIFTVLCCLDITSEVVAEAVDMRADIIITHHPFIFDGIKNITKDTPQGRSIITLIKNDIAVYCAHLSFDVAPYGINQIMADKLGLEDCKVIEPVGEEAGLGRIGRLKEAKTLNEIYESVLSITGGKNVKTSGEPDRGISTVAVICGAGGGDAGLIRKISDMGADLFITGEIKHHVAVLAKELNLALIDAGHYYTELIGIPALCGLVASYAEAGNIDIEVYESQTDTNPFN